MLLINKFFAPINIALIIINLWSHQLLWAILAALCLWLNVMTIKRLENSNG